MPWMSLGVFPALFALFTLAGCGEQATRFDSLGLLQKNAQGIKTIQAIDSTSVWAGKCVSKDKPKALWGAALILENQADSTALEGLADSSSIRILGGPKTEEKAFYPSKQEDVLKMRDDAFISATLTYTGANHSLRGQTSDGGYAISGQSGEAEPGVSVIYFSADTALQTSFRCYFSQDKTSRSSQENERAENAVHKILK